MENYYRRPLPEGLVAFSSPEGRALFREALAAGGMEGWFPLAENFHTQSEPPFCALGSLANQRDVPAPFRVPRTVQRRQGSRAVR